MSENVKEPFHKKWWFWVIILFVLVGVNNAIKGESQPTTSSAPAQEAAKPEQPASQEQTTAQSEPAPESSQPETIEDKVKAIIIDAVEDQTNMDKERIVKLEINDHAGTEKEGDKIALITLNADENLTANMTKVGMLMDSSDIFRPLFEIPEIEEVVLFWQLTLVDPYGNEKDDAVLKITLTREIAGKINWENFDWKNYATVASDYWEHPALKQ